MTYLLQTNEGSHPAHPEWITHSEHATADEAKAELRNQSFAEDVGGRFEATTFGLNGVRIIKA